MKRFICLLSLACILLLAACSNASTGIGKPTATDHIYLREANRFLQDPTNTKIPSSAVARSIRNGVNLTSDPEQYKQLAALIADENIEAAIQLYEQLSGEQIKSK